MKKSAWVLGGCLWAVGCGGTEPTEVGRSVQALQGGFEVDFNDCTEFAGVGFIPGANARAAVPLDYTPAGDATTGVIVVRVASCSDVRIDGGAPTPTIVAQIGVNLIPPDGTGDINNYAVWYHTDNPHLKNAFKKLGVDAQMVPQLRYQVTLDPGGATGQLHLESRHPTFAVDGPIVVPTAPAVPFIANWWDLGKQDQQVKANTVLPAIQFSGASTVLTTPAGSALANLIGGTSLTFPALDSYNSFAAAHMVVDYAP